MNRAYSFSLIININTSKNHDINPNSSFQSKIFTATGTHLEALAHSISSKSYFSGIEVQLEKIKVGDSSTSGGSTSVGYLHAVFNAEQTNIVSKSSNWDTYVDSITFPQGTTFNGYARINYKNAFTSLPNVQDLR